MKNNIQESRFDNEGLSINIRAELEKYLIYWKWFLAGIIVFLTLAFLFLRYTTPRYSATTSILIKDNKKAGISAEFEAFKDLGIIGAGSSNNPDNEIEILKSRRVIGKVVDALNLDVFYYVSGRVKQTEVYKNSSPIKLDIISKNTIFQMKDTILNVRIINDYNYEFLNDLGNVTSTHTFGEIVTNKVGTFKLERNKLADKKDVNLRILPKYLVIDSYRNRFNISTVNKNSSVLRISLEDAVLAKAEDVLDELVRQYNIDAINDKNQVSEKTNEFINSRLKKVKSDLFIIDKNVEEFKTSKDFIGLPVEVQIAFESLKETNKDIIEINTQLSLANWMEESLKKESDKDDLLPTSIGFDDNSLVRLILSYNDILTEINKTEVSAGEKNPVLRSLKVRLSQLKSSLLRSLSNVRNSLELQLEELKKEEGKVLSKVKSIPSNERDYIDIAREQEIIAGLYSYLLKKKEETDISLAVTVPNAKIIDIAYGSNNPVYPKSKIIYLLAFFLGLLVPFIFIYIYELLDTKIHNKGDIETFLSVPFLGDVPRSDSKDKVIIGNDIRSSTAEAFRLIRTNLDFMLASNNRKQSKSIFVTSTTSGEGKSFISINLAATLALSGQKVLLMGMDLRAPKVTEYLGIPERKGVTNYITDEDMTLESLIFSIPEIKGLDIMSSGVIPPNPAELLMTKRVENLFTIVKQEYDVVLVDTAPVNLVTDTLLISKYADMFMYVVRANYLDRRLLAVPQELYNEKKLPNMAIVLNDTDPKRSYGYGYGGYGYGYVVVEKPWYKKIFDRS